VAAASPARTTAATTKIIVRFMAPILKMIPDCQLVVEELHGAVLHTVLRSPRSTGPSPLDSPLEQRRPVSQVRNRSPDVLHAWPRRRAPRGSFAMGGREQRLDCRPDAIDYGAPDWATRGPAAGGALATWRPTAPHWVWPTTKAKPRPEHLGRKLDAPHLRRRDDVAGDADDEQGRQSPAQKISSDGNARVGAPEHDRERLFAPGPGRPPEAAPFSTKRRLPSRQPAPALSRAGIIGWAEDFLGARAMLSPTMRPMTSPHC